VLKMYFQVTHSYNDIFQDHLVRVFSKVITIMYNKILKKNSIVSHYNLHKFIITIGITKCGNAYMLYNDFGIYPLSIILFKTNYPPFMKDKLNNYM
jgi:hypothetical protein